MKLLFLFFILQTTYPQSTVLRKLYTFAVAQKDSADRFTGLLAPVGDQSAPVLRCYKGVASMVQARYAPNPLTKLALFRKGKAWIEGAVNADTTNLEMRYLRLTIQDNLPAILNYKDAILQDRRYLQAHIGEEKDDDLKNIINIYLTK